MPGGDRIASRATVLNLICTFIAASMPRIALAINIEPRARTSSARERELDLIALLALASVRHPGTAPDDLIRASHRGWMILWVPCVRGESINRAKRQMNERANAIWMTSGNEGKRNIKPHRIMDSHGVFAQRRRSSETLMGGPDSNTAASSVTNKHLRFYAEKHTTRNTTEHNTLHSHGPLAGGLCQRSTF